MEVCVYITHHRGPGTESLKEQRGLVVQEPGNCYSVPISFTMYEVYIPKAFWHWNRGCSGGIE